MVRLVVKATLSGSSYPRRTSFPDAFSLGRHDLALKLARSFSLQPGSFRLAYRDDDNDLIELVSTSDLHEALDFFSSDASSSSSASTSAWFGIGGSTSTAKPDAPEYITLKLELLVDYDGPSLSESGSSVYSLGGTSSSRSGSSSAGSDDSRGWRSLRIEGGPVPRSRRALSTGSTTSDAESDRWILRTAYSDSRAPGGRGRGGQSEGREEGEREVDDEEWDRRTVSSASQAFGAARPHASRRRARHQDPFDAHRIPPAPDSHGDGLSPNFARGHFTPADPHPYPLYPDREHAHAHAPSYAHLHGAYPPPPFYPHHLAPPPPPPHFAHAYPPPFFPPFPHAHLHTPYPPPPAPGFFPGDRPPPPASSFTALSLGSSGGWASPTASQRDRARDLFASSSEGRGSAGGSASAREAARPEEDERDGDDEGERASSYTVTSSGDGRPEGDREVDVREGEGSRARDGAFVCVVCGDEISGPRYTCAVCEGFDLCQECERLPDPPASSASTAHDSLHILLKIPVASSTTSSSSSSSASASSIKAAVSRATSLAHPSTRSSTSTSTSTAHERVHAPHPGVDVADYWSWWSSWYGPHAHAHLRAAYHPPPPPSSWYASAAGPVSAPGSTAASVPRPVKDEPPAARDAPVAVPPPSVALALPPVPAPPLPPTAPAPPALGAAPYTVPPAPPVPPPPPPMYPLASRRPPVRAHPSYGLYEYPNHGVACRHCSRVIPGPSAMGVLPTADGKERGVRWLCANCPTAPSYDLCPDCEPLSQQIHDPSHAFLRITHPIRRPLPSVRALLPLLYVHAPVQRPASSAPSASVREMPERDLLDLQSESSVTSVDSGGSGSSGGSARTEFGSSGTGGGAGAAGQGTATAVGDVINHGRVMCDACGRRVMRIWMACCHCPTSFDLCTPCLLDGASAKQAHNPAHVWVALKRPVDFALHERLTKHQSRRPRGLLEVDLYA
ncbi:hypothetical protein JCM8208_006661 [Rhodotorula glutinis]